MGVRSKHATGELSTHTSRSLMDLVLDEEIDHWDDRSKEPKLDYEKSDGKSRVEPTDAIATCFLHDVSEVSDG